MATHLETHMFDNIIEMVDCASRRYAKKRAFTICLPNGMTGGLTFAQVDSFSRAFARYLTDELRLPQGTRVAVQIPNCLAFPVSVLGVLRAGCVLVNVNPLYTESELLQQVGDSGARVLVIIDLFADKARRIYSRTAVDKVVTVNIADFMPAPLRLLIVTKQKIAKQLTTPSIPVESMRQCIARNRKKGSSKEERSLRIGRDGLALLQYTGGTTGISKGAMLTHGNIVSNVQQIADFCDYRFVPGEDVVLTALPLYHILAFSVNFLLLYALGAENILIPSPRPITNLMPAFRKFRVTMMSGVNTLYRALLNDPSFRANPPRSLKVVVAGGSSLPPATAEEWERVVGTCIIEGYGLSETSPVVCLNPFDGSHRLGTVGKPVSGTTIAIADEEGRHLPVGEIGEILISGPQVMRGYWNQPAETAMVMRDGWFHTGDIGMMDEDGYCRILDRKKEMIIVSGFNVYPNEVEAQLASLADISEVAVVGIPDDITGERVHASVVPANLTNPPSLEAVRAHCAQTLTKYKLPSSISFCAELPKTPVGKVLRREVRAALQKEFGVKTDTVTDAVTGSVLPQQNHNGASANLTQ